MDSSLERNLIRWLFIGLKLQSAAFCNWTLGIFRQEA